MQKVSPEMPAEGALRVLLVEDSPADEELIVHRLHHDGLVFSHRRVETADFLVRALSDFDPDILLCDNRLPNLDAVSAIEIVAGMRPHLPIIIVTGTLDDEAAAALMKAGAVDFIRKDRLGRLTVAVTYALDRVRAQRTRREQEAKLHENEVAGKEALRKSEERFRQVVEAAPNAMILINAAGQIEMINTETERLFGYTRSELLGAQVEMLLPVKMRDRHPELRASFFTEPTGRPTGEGRALFGLKKDGSEVEVEVGRSPIETDEGMMVLLAVLDISDRVRMEAQVRQAQKMHAIGRVTAGVAHDFNNLLLALSGSLEMLLDAVADQPEAAEWGEIALRATTRGKELTDRLLSFSRQQHLVAHPIMIEVLFSELRELVGHLFGTNTKARTELVIIPCPAGLAVLADHAQLEAALINLAVNARDAMAFGGVLRISAYDTEADPAIVPPGRYTVISVADTGAGMDADTLSQACDPFFSTKGVKGTGLGLSMVHGFARQSGGQAHITSVVGEGTTIDLWLPSASVPSAVETPAHTVGRILVVDDSQDALLVVSAFLRRAGLDVITKTSGDLALAELAEGRRFDAIVTDFAMPGMNGLDVLTLAREIDPSMAGMIITGFSDPELLSGLDGMVVLRKPFNRVELTETVQELIASKYVVAS